MNSEFSLDHYDVTVSVDQDDGEDKSEDEQEELREESSGDDSMERVIEEDLEIPEQQISEIEMFVEDKEYKLARDGELFAKWIFMHIQHHKNLHPERVALVEEIDETRCVTYFELIEGISKCANYLRHHGIREGAQVAICMENCIEYVFYLFALYRLGAVPVLLSPSNIDKTDKIECLAAIVDFDHYGTILRETGKLVNIQHVFVLAAELSQIYVPRHVWIYDGYGFVDFPATYKHCMPLKDEVVTIFHTSGSHSKKGKFVSHKSKSSQLACLEYYEKLFEGLEDQEQRSRQSHMISSGLNTIDAWSYLCYSLVRGDTCILAECATDVFRASLLDKVAGLIDQYRIQLIISNVQLLRCFLKYELQNVYDLSCLKVIANTGSPISKRIAKKITELFGITLIQGYSAFEFGVVSFGEFDDSEEGPMMSCGEPASDVKVKVVKMLPTQQDFMFQIAGLKSECEIPVGEWGQIMVSSPRMFSGYLDTNANSEAFLKNWLKTGDYGKLDDQNKLFVAGPVCNLVKIEGTLFSLDYLESILCEHEEIDDVVLHNVGDKLYVGILAREEAPPPDVEELQTLLKNNEMNVTIDSVVVLDFIPRLETGKIQRGELDYLFTGDHQDVVVVNKDESYI